MVELLEQCLVCLMVELTVELMALMMVACLEHQKAVMKELQTVVQKVEL
jgi:hypothetical protein